MTDLQTIHNNFTLNFMDVRGDDDKARFEPLINRGLSMAMQTTDNPQLVGAFVQNVLLFEPSYAAKILQQLSNVVANTGDTDFITLHGKIAENYKLPQGKIIGIGTQLVAKPL